MRNENGEFSCAENGIDIKVGGKSNDEKDIVRILGNRIWGFRKNLPECGGTGSWGDGIVVHVIADNILLKNNILFNLPSGISISPGKNEGSNKSGKIYVAIINNLVF